MPTCLLAESLMHGGQYAEALEQLGQLERPNRPGAIPTDRLLVALTRATVAWPKSLWERQDA